MDQVPLARILATGRGGAPGDAPGQGGGHQRLSPHRVLVDLIEREPGPAHQMLDVAVDVVGVRVTDPARALLPRTGSVRRDGLRVCALSTGLGDKAVSLFYESLLRAAPSDVWIQRCKLQISDTLDVLERDRSRRSTTYWLGDALSHADVAVAYVLRFTAEAHPGLIDGQRWPFLAAHAARCEALEDFRVIAQPFTVRMPETKSEGNRPSPLVLSTEKG